MEYSVHDGSAFLVRPGCWHSYAPDVATGWTEYFIRFNGKVFSKIIQQTFPQENCLFRLSPKTQSLFPKALKWADADNEETQTALQSLLFNLIVHIGYNYEPFPANGKRSSQPIVQARDYMERNISRPFSLKELSSELGISYSTFNQLFKLQTGLSPIRYLNQMRIQRAKYKLMRTDLSVKAVALDCGFSSTEYFCGFFRKETGMTPSEFRKATARQE